jgi:hypothetical protein
VVLKLLPVFLLALAGCGDRAATVEAAKAAADAALPASPPAAARRFVRAIDLGDKWRLVYEGEGTAGAAIFDVDKRRGEIINAAVGQ